MAVRFIDEDGNVRTSYGGALTKGTSAIDVYNTAQRTAQKFTEDAKAHSGRDVQMFERVVKSALGYDQSKSGGSNVNTFTSPDGSRSFVAYDRPMGTIRVESPYAQAAESSKKILRDSFTKLMSTLTSGYYGQNAQQEGNGKAAAEAIKRTNAEAETLAASKSKSEASDNLYGYDAHQVSDFAAKNADTLSAMGLDASSASTTSALMHLFGVKQDTSAGGATYDDGSASPRADETSTTPDASGQAEGTVADAVQRADEAQTTSAGTTATADATTTPTPENTLTTTTYDIGGATVSGSDLATVRDAEVYQAVKSGIDDNGPSRLASGEYSTTDLVNYYSPAATNQAETPVVEDQSTPSAAQTSQPSTSDTATQFAAAQPEQQQQSGGGTSASIADSAVSRSSSDEEDERERQADMKGGRSRVKKAPPRFLKRRR